MQPYTPAAQLPRLPPSIIDNNRPLTTTKALVLRPYILRPYMRRHHVTNNDLQDNPNFRAFINNPTYSPLPPQLPHPPSLSSQLHATVSDLMHGIHSTVIHANNVFGNLVLSARSNQQTVSTRFNSLSSRMRPTLPHRQASQEVGPSHPLYYQPHDGPPGSGGASGSSGSSGCNIISL